MQDLMWMDVFLETDEEAKFYTQFYTQCAMDKKKIA